MSLSLSMTVAFLAAIASVLAGTRAATAQRCKGPFAIEIKAQCAPDPDGKQRMTFIDENAKLVAV